MDILFVKSVDWFSTFNAQSFAKVIWGKTANHRLTVCKSQIDYSRATCYLMIEKWFVEMKFDNVRNAEIRSRASSFSSNWKFFKVGYPVDTPTDGIPGSCISRCVLTYPRLQKERICDSCRWAAEETLISASAIPRRGGLESLCVPFLNLRSSLLCKSNKEVVVLASGTNKPTK